MPFEESLRRRADGYAMMAAEIRAYLDRAAAQDLRVAALPYPLRQSIMHLRALHPDFLWKEEHKFLDAFDTKTPAAIEGYVVGYLAANGSGRSISSLAELAQFVLKGGDLTP